MWRRHVDVLLTGTFVVCRTVARHMVDRREGGAIVTVGSIGGIRHFNQFGAYCTAKAGVKMLTEGLASELGAHRIRVNCVLPGIIRTELAGPLLELSPTTSREALTRVPVGHFGEPDDVADAIAFLASDASRFVDGHSLVVDGGNLLHDHHWFHTDYSVAHQGDWTAI